MSLIGYVSDERYLALPQVAVEITDGRRHWWTRSTASGAIHVDLPPGDYRVTLARDGYGAKHADAWLGSGRPHQFRLLSDRILGYVWPKWVRAGDRGEFRVHSPEPYRLSLWRHGAEAEPERLIGWFDEHAPRATVQVTPDGDYTGDGVRFNEQGYTDPAHRQYLSAPGRGGLYFFRAEGESGARFSFPWVVAPGRPGSPIAVLASTNTWNAYNNFGGRSNYVNAAGLPDAPVLVPRREMRRYQESGFSEHEHPDEAYPPLSFDRPEPLNQIDPGDRPEDPIRGRQPCHLAAAEWRLISWLERSGYRHDLYADAHLHDGTLNLDDYRVLVLNSHPEYWSRQMYSAVHSWVHERGGKLAYLGGNGVDCEVEFTEANTALRFRTQAAGAHESRIHRSFRPTSGLLGVVFTSAGAMTGAPYEVCDPDHWAFTDTGLAAGDLFGVRSLHERCPGGASAHETDKTGRHTPPGTRLLARGRNPGEGGAEIVSFRTGSGGEVFSAGSIAWPAAVLVDDVVSTITRNVLDRFLAGAPLP
ncbi:carboxypeptidase-like regulatory domain-containing protein [Amycolatopsis anabasis]|uniref:carboxypeptidase-like regulatory domain-containing protein n=1 Tax=Amycolatopsis anabasis TaxID=1840409 RepID=UPI00131C0A02|nr:carboxypeptidase-like regulatory domain-containing protein [Amycolatopsis anabasis]